MGKLIINYIKGITSIIWENVGKSRIVLIILKIDSNWHFNMEKK